MIRQFCSGLWLAPDFVVGIACSDRTITVVLQANGSTGTGWYLNFRGDEELADEIGTAARIAQEARLAADTRLHREVPIPSPAEQAAQFPADTAGRSE